MSRDSQSADDSARNAARLNGDQVGHGLERDRTSRPAGDNETQGDGVTRTQRQPDPGPAANATGGDNSAPGRDALGNSSETGRGGIRDGEPAAGNGPRQDRPRLPVRPGCARATGTMFIAGLSVVAFVAHRIRS